MHVCHLRRCVCRFSCVVNNILHQTLIRRMVETVERQTWSDLLHGRWQMWWELGPCVCGFVFLLAGHNYSFTNPKTDIDPVKTALLLIWSDALCFGTTRTPKQPCEGWLVMTLANFLAFLDNNIPSDLLIHALTCHSSSLQAICGENYQLMEDYARKRTLLTCWARISVILIRLCEHVNFSLVSTCMPWSKVENCTSEYLYVSQAVFIGRNFEAAHCDCLLNSFTVKSRCPCLMADGMGKQNVFFSRVTFDDDCF